MQLITNGIKVGEYRPDRSEDAVDIRVRYPSEQRGVIALDELQIVTPGGLVPLSNFVKVKPSNNVDTLQRVNGVPIMMILANVAPGVLADSKVKEIQTWIDSQDWPPELRIKFRGANEEQAESLAFVGVAFGMSLLLMFVLLVTQFNSFYQSSLFFCSCAFNRRRTDWPVDHRQSLQRYFDGCWCSGAGGHRREQQHRLDRHLQRDTKQKPRYALCRIDRATGSNA